MFFKIVFLKNFAAVIKKRPVLERLFNNVAVLRRLQHSYFPISIVKFLITAFCRTLPGAASVATYIPKMTDLSPGLERKIIIYLIMWIYVVFMFLA